MVKTVLVVDDSLMMRKIVVKNINEMGIVVTIKEAANGQDGLDIFKAGGIDCVISDWIMPIMDGVTMIREIRKLDSERKTSILMVATEGGVENIKTAIMAGANYYLIKPFTAKLIKEKLTKVLE